jgi:hypothetical protein
VPSTGAALSLSPSDRYAELASVDIVDEAGAIFDLDVRL